MSDYLFINTGMINMYDVSQPVETTIPQTESARIVSIDILRGLAVMAMIFVNDIAGVNGVPNWMKQAPINYDGMTFADLVFPAFLFIIGIFVPFSVGKRLNIRDQFLPAIKYVLLRTIGLVILGFFIVNSYSIADQGIINPHLWIVLVYLCGIIIWSNHKPGSLLSNRTYKYIAAALLVVLFFLYRGNDQTGIIQMRFQWWGIPGLLGIAYLFAVLLYIPFRKRIIAILECTLLLYFLYMAIEAGMGAQFSILSSLNSFTSLAAIVMSGILFGTKLNNFRLLGQERSIIKWGINFSVFLFISGLMFHQLNGLHKMFIISEALETIPWALFSTAITIWIWLIIYLLVDIKGLSKWHKLIEAAGTNPLFAYLLAPLLIHVVILISYMFTGHNFYWWLGESFYAGLLRALFLAFGITWFAGYLSKKGWKLKLTTD